MAFCGKCGSKNLDEDSFCVVCGSPLRKVQPQQPAVLEPMPIVQPAPVVQQPLAAQQEPPAQAPSFQKEIPAPKKLSRKTVILICALVAAVAVLTAAVCIGVEAWENYQVWQTTMDYIEAYYSADAKGVLNRIEPEMLDYYCEIGGYDTKSECREALEKLIKNYVKSGEYFYEVIAMDDCMEPLWEELQDYYEDQFDQEIEAAKTVWIQWTYEDEGRQTCLLTLIKVEGQWYVNMYPFIPPLAN